MVGRLHTLCTPLLYTPRVRERKNKVDKCAPFSPFLTVLSGSFPPRYSLFLPKVEEREVRTEQFCLKVNKCGKCARMSDLGLFYLRVEIGNVDVSARFGENK